MIDLSISEERSNRFVRHHESEKQMTKETWLPRFTREDLLFPIKFGGRAGDPFPDCDPFSHAASVVNKRLEEFEAKCTIIATPDEEFLQTPSRRIDKRVSVEEIINTLRSIPELIQRKQQLKTFDYYLLAERIEKMGIIND